MLVIFDNNLKVKKKYNGEGAVDRGFLITTTGKAYGFTS